MTDRWWLKGDGGEGEGGLLRLLIPMVFIALLAGLWGLLACWLVGWLNGAVVPLRSSSTNLWVSHVWPGYPSIHSPIVHFMFECLCMCE